MNLNIKHAMDFAQLVKTNNYKYFMFEVGGLEIEITNTLPEDLVSKLEICPDFPVDIDYWRPYELQTILADAEDEEYNISYYYHTLKINTHIFKNCVLAQTDTTDVIAFMDTKNTIACDTYFFKRIC